MVTVRVWSDIACPWSSLAVFRLHAARERLGLAGTVGFDLLAWPLELVNNRPTPKPSLDVEAAVIGSHEPALGWRPWRGPDSGYAVSSLLALEAVQAAKDDSAGGRPASEELDLALRQALFADSRCITLYDVVVDVARQCDRVDADALADALERGTARSRVFAQWRESPQHGVQGSPHVVLPDGSSSHNPGITFHWSDGSHGGYPVIDGDDAEVYEHLLRRAAGGAVA